jgi:hypothetical protein
VHSPSLREKYMVVLLLVGSGPWLQRLCNELGSWVQCPKLEHPHRGRKRKISRQRKAQ